MIDRSRRCPHCGRTNGLYTRSVHEVEIKQYSFDGDFISRFFEQAYEEEEEMMYCQSCDGAVCDTSEYETLFSKRG